MKKYEFKRVKKDDAKCRDCGKLYKFEESPFDLFLNEFRGKPQGMSDTTIFDKSPVNTSEEILENLTDKSSETDKTKEISGNKKTTSYTTQNDSVAIDKDNTETTDDVSQPGLYDDDEELSKIESPQADNDEIYKIYSTFNHKERNAVKTKIKKKQNVSSKITKKYKKGNSKKTKRENSFEKWASSFNAHCKEIEAYPLCIEKSCLKTKRLDLTKLIFN